MAHAISYATIAEIVNIDTGTLPQGYAAVCIELKAWVILDKLATDGAVINQIFVPTVGTGRWFRSNNNYNKLNLPATPITTTGGTTTLDFTSTEFIYLTMNQATTINLQATLRNGLGRLQIMRTGTGFNITGWDGRTRWGAGNSAYTFPGSNTTAVVEFVCNSNLIYITRTATY